MSPLKQSRGRVALELHTGRDKVVNNLSLTSDLEINRTSLVVNVAASDVKEIKKTVPSDLIFYHKFIGFCLYLCK